MEDAKPRKQCWQKSFEWKTYVFHGVDWQQDELELILEKEFIIVKCMKVNLEIFCPYNLRARAIQNPPFQGMESVHQDDSGNTE